MSLSHFPIAIEEIIKRQQGFCLFVGERHSKLMQTYGHVRSLLGEVEGFEISDLSVPKVQIPTSADAIFIQGALDTQLKLDLAVSAAEEGRIVVNFQFADSAVTALRRLFSSPLGEGRKHLLARLSEQCRFISAEKAIKSIEGSFETVRELLLVSPEMRQMIAGEDVRGVESILCSDHSSLGTVSMNQSLLQLMLRRRIDVKTAFLASRDPSELDLMMKKVGI